MPITEFIKWNLPANDPSFAAESKQIVPDQTAPSGAVNQNCLGQFHEIRPLMYIKDLL